MLKKAIFSFFILSLLFPLASNALMMAPWSIISGTVRDGATGETIGGAQISFIEIWYPNNHLIGWDPFNATVTDDEGYYFFEFYPPPIAVDIVIRADGYIEKRMSNIKTPFWSNISQDIYLEKEQTINPVILIPGIMGSWYVDGEWRLDPITDVYDDLYNSLKLAGYEPGKNLFAFPYDWGMSNVINAVKLKDKINEIKSVTGTNKVDLVAHSMGGLIARQYIESDNYEEDVDQLIFLGTPQKGATESYLTWEGAEGFSGIDGFFSKIIFSFLAHSRGYDNLYDFIRSNIISVKELLPVYDYLRNGDSGVLRRYPENYPGNNFLNNLNNQENLNKLIDSNIDITNFVSGSDSNTLNILSVADFNGGNKWEYGEPKGYEYSSGDGTVPLDSASLGLGVYEIKLDSDHRKLPSIARKEIIKILLSDDKPLFIWGMEEAEDWNSYTVADSYMIIGVYSPIDILLTDSTGRQIGSGSDSGNEIKGAFYSGQNDPEFIVIPNPSEGGYKIWIEGTNSGEYGLSVSYISDNKENNNNFTGLIESGQNQQIEFFYNSNNGEEIIGSLTKKVDIQDVINDIEMIYREGWLAKNSDKKILINRLDILDKNLNRNRKEKFVDKELNLFIRELEKIYSKDRISEKGYNLLISDINYLKNNDEWRGK